MLHFVGNVVECRVPVDFTFRGREELARLVGIARHDLSRGHDPQAHPFEAPRVSIARMGERELRVRSMNAANMPMRKTALGADEYLPERPVTAHAAFLARRFASCAAAASRTQAPLSQASRRAFMRSFATGPSPRTTA